MSLPRNRITSYNVCYTKLLRMDSKLSQRIKEVLNLSREEAERLGNNFIAPEHLFLGIIREGEGRAIDALEAFNVDLSEIKRDIEIEMRSDEITIKGASIPLLRTNFV